MELLGEQTLDDLHAAIQAAFGWDDDHLYLFRLGKSPRDRSADHLCAGCDDGELFTDAALASLPLYRRRKFWYLYDFGDCLLHEVQVVKIGPRPPRARFPRCVARQGKVLVVVEVKTRRGSSFGAPQEAVTPTKQGRLRRLADYYLKAKRLTGSPVRFDVVAVTLAEHVPRMEIIQDAF